jgi:hypothetical protein
MVSLNLSHKDDEGIASALHLMTARVRQQGTGIDDAEILHVSGDGVVVAHSSNQTITAGINFRPDLRVGFFQRVYF